MVAVVTRAVFASVAVYSVLFFDENDSKICLFFFYGFVLVDFTQIDDKHNDKSQL